jgi:predicted transposase YbfD/YdcC
VWVTDELQWLGAVARDWPGLAAVAAVECQREDLASGKISTQRRYFISSCRNLSAQAMATAVRWHWAIENKVHWQLDVSFNEAVVW